MATAKSTEIIREMIQLGADVINEVRGISLPRSVEDQLIRSVTSIGANFTEAQDASSKRDFINKIYIAKKEASETKYWLAVVAKLSNNEEKMAPLSQRCHKYVMLLQKIINSSKENNRK